MHYGLLARCPHCGGRVDMGTSESLATHKKTYFVECDSCGACVDFEGIDFTQEGSYAAVAAWNRRAEAADEMSCPFCGGPVTFHYYEGEDEFDMPSYGIECSCCHTYTSFWGSIEEPEAVKEETMRRWTRRSEAT